MITIYPPGTKLPDSYGQVLNGLAAVMDEPDEVDELIAFCRLAPRPPEDPLTAVYRFLRDPSLDLAAWGKYWNDLNPSANKQTTISADENHNAPRSEVGKLILALKIAKTLWDSQGGESLRLKLFVLIAEPVSLGVGTVRLDGQGSAMVIRPGSLFGELACMPLKILSFGVCLVLGGGTTTSARRRALVDNLRNSALASEHTTPPLQSLWTKPLEDRKQTLIVLVHGLLATDVGTFKYLERQLRESRFADIVGFSHDTVSQSIEANGSDLAAHVDRLDYPRVYCIAHSRGGLVVRRAAVYLTKCGKKIEHCVTFGTPHLGAEMAEIPGSLIALLAFLQAGFVLQAGSINHSVASLVDILCCAGEKCQFPGIEDMRPASTRDTWLAHLQDEERPIPTNSRMQVFAIGGITPRPANLMERIAGFTSARIMGQEESDLVVAKSSAIPFLASKSLDLNCNHFGYFQEEHKATLDQVVTFLKEESCRADGVLSSRKKKPFRQTH